MAVYTVLNAYNAVTVQNMTDIMTVHPTILQGRNARVYPAEAPVWLEVHQNIQRQQAMRGKKAEFGKAITMLTKSTLPVIQQAWLCAKNNIEEALRFFDGRSATRSL